MSGVRPKVAVVARRIIQFSDEVREAVFVISRIRFIVSTNIAGEFGPFFFYQVRFQDGTLNFLPAIRIDRVCNIGMKFGPAIRVANGPVLVELASTLVAKAGPQVVFTAALQAPIGELAAGHGHERPLGSFYNLEITYDEHIVERDRAEGQQAFVVVFHELNTDFADYHS